MSDEASKRGAAPEHVRFVKIAENIVADFV
jgi:hypothetical protein